MKKLILFAALGLISAANANEPKWAPVNIELGCVNFSDMYKRYPFLSGTKTPSEVLNILRKIDTEAKITPMLELSDEALTEVEKGRAEDSQAFKLFTKKNAVVISWTSDGKMDGLLFYETSLCKAIYGNSRKE